MIKVNSVTKRYGVHTAVNRVSFEVNEGEVVGFLGPNGAGKSTTMNIITGYLSASEGSVEVDGYDVLEHPKEVKSRIGYLPEQPPLYLEMTVREYLRFVARLKKAGPDADGSTMQRILELVGIAHVHDRLIKNLSKGYRQRVGLAQALVGNPKVLILDEPTIGLDPHQIIEIRNLVRELGKAHTIILSSHILPEVSAVCDRIMIINNGSLVASDTAENLSKRMSGSGQYLLRVVGSESAVQGTLKGVAGVSGITSHGVVEADSIDIVVDFAKDSDPRRAIFAALSKTEMPILQMKPIDVTLEQIFLQLTTEDAVATDSASANANGGTA